MSWGWERPKGPPVYPEFPSAAEYAAQVAAMPLPPAKLGPRGPRPIDNLRMYRLLRKALADGAKPEGGAVLRWWVHGKCREPREVVLVSQLHTPDEGCWVPGPFGRGPYVFQWEDWKPIIRDKVQIKRPFYLYMYRPCRKCPECLEARKKLWQARACAEFDSAARTWFVTLTLRPEARFYALADGGQKRFINREWTKVLKRLRKNVGLPFRYLSVLEEHEDGALHLHALLHDVVGKIPKAAVRGEWSHGITHCVLADKNKCFYISKYLLKSTCGRVRASLRYGDPLGIGKVSFDVYNCVKDALDASTPLSST